MRYSLVASILQPLESDHLVVLSTHFAICLVSSHVALNKRLDYK